MYRFYIDESDFDGRFARITGEDVNHIANVLRLNTGEWIVCCNGSGIDHIGRISDISRDEVLVDIEKTVPTGNELDLRMVLFQGLPKGDKMDLIVQKAVEVGAYRIIPVAMARSVVRLDPKKASKKQERWQKIALAAAKQCDRGMIPEVTQPVSFDEALQMAGELDKSILPYEVQNGMQDTDAVLNEAADKKSVGIFIGPEGGFEKDEVDKAVSKGIKTISLGRRILRTETAGLVTMSVLMYKSETKVSKH
ncbi:MAG: 16S rRNA (uracil(1498)-N(3))-methyltransferase [Lachnospiraceae bacterium]|jgi:16S rRNA (uracil1498-N3)-methyltransferase|nr:16S rRNA (uracil(1498)-N(3))-methyltransferase [Lachnospiraceae bacterium]MEE3460746.1 16S rRNA (uracil(1498)-N(3))-methyltransferase [Lachnospiraceae bacterium]